MTYSLILAAALAMASGVARAESSGPEAGGTSFSEDSTNCGDAGSSCSDDSVSGAVQTADDDSMDDNSGRSEADDDNGGDHDSSGDHDGGGDHDSGGDHDGGDHDSGDD